MNVDIYFFYLFMNYVLCTGNNCVTKDIFSLNVDEQYLRYFVIKLVVLLFVAVSDERYILPIQRMAAVQSYPGSRHSTAETVFRRHHL